MAIDKRKDFEIINLKHLARVSGMDYTQLRNCVSGVYGSWNDEDKTKLFNAMHQEISKAAAALGFTYEGRRIRPKD
jgi:hypothetical protein